MPQTLAPSPADLVSAVHGAVHLFRAGQRGAAEERGLLERQEDLDLQHVRRHLAAAVGGGGGVSLRDPHFGRLAPAGAANGALAIHMGDLGLNCPLPGAVNVQVVRRRELLDLARERMDRSRPPFRRRILGLMDHVLVLEPDDRLRAGGVSEFFDGLSLLRLPADADADAGGAPLPGGPGKPIQHRAADFQTGPYNHLGHPDRAKPGSSHLRVLAERAAAAGRRFAVLFASPEAMEEAAMLMRVFRALREGGTGTELLVLFFGSPEDMDRAVAGDAGAVFFNDNFACPAVRCVFAPFPEEEVAAALRQAAAVFDTAYGGALERLAGRLGLRRLFTVAADGRYAEWEDGRPVDGTLDMAGLFTEEAILRLGRKVDRRAERDLVLRLQNLFGAK